MSRFGRWWVRHRRIWPLHRLLHWGGWCLPCRAVWADVGRDARFVEAIERGTADIAAGRWFHYDPETGETTPNLDWPKDGPQPGDGDLRVLTG